MNFIISNQENFQIHLYTILIHRISTTFKDHMPTNLSCFQNSTFYAGIKIFNSFAPSLTVLKNDKTKFKAALRKYLLFLLCR